MPRAPKLNIDKNKKPHRSNAELDERERKTPKYLSQEFIPPDTLTAAELRVWDWLVSIFKETINCRVSDADVFLMESFCRTKVALDEADEAYKADPRPYMIVALGKDKNGNVKTTAKPNPYKKDRKDYLALLNKQHAELGLSPTGRAKTGLAAVNEQNELDIFKEIMNRTDD